jgi:hypothetical protein
LLVATRTLAVRVEMKLQQELQVFQNKVSFGRGLRPR